MAVSSKIETIGDFKYIVERREDGTIICQSLYNEPVMNIISNIVLWNRFEAAEQENLVDSINKKIRRFLYELRLRSTVDLLDQKLRSAINALESTSILEVGRAAEILAI